MAIPSQYLSHLDSCVPSTSEVSGTFYFFFFFSQCHVASEILVPQTAVELSPMVEVWSRNHWTTRDIPISGALEEKQSYQTNLY